MPLLNLTPDELLSTTRSVRKRLDLTRPVEPELIRECLELALQAPTGGKGVRVAQHSGKVILGDATLFQPFDHFFFCHREKVR